MTHQFSHCTCGQPQHWPATARIGDTWACRRCGRVTRLVAPGTPGASAAGAMIRSRPPRRRFGAPRPPMRAPARAPALSLARALRTLFAALSR